ncbi:serine/threonine-protein kinase [Diaminobutyricibacter sp. McL0608]|uniref:serine/threonine-protein kinase n=1 Tax=Leifsonia sp. McL0608 TaxID=3143537 RepID=UPI0031F2FDC7
MSRQQIDAPLLLDRYRPQRLLARGGSSLVFLATDENLSREVALKLFASGRDEYEARFRAELRVLASLRHHGVVSILDAGVDHSTPDDPRPFLVMELVDGDTLRTGMENRTMSTRRIGEVGFEVAEALEYVHTRGVIHRDVTPSNIMLVDYGTRFSRPRAQLTDFGIAIDSFTPQEVDRTMGTAAYLSPEQALNKPLTPASDIYSLGLVLLECFTGARAFPGSAVASAIQRLDADPDIPSTVPTQWQSLIRRMTDRDPAARPSSADVASAAREALRTMGASDDD